MSDDGIVDDNGIINDNGIIDNNENKIIEQPEENIKGIGGWLILVLIGLFFSLFQIIVLTIRTIRVFSNGTLPAIAKIGTNFGSPGLAKLITIQFTVNIIIGIFIIYLLLLCFTMKKLFSKLMIVYYAFNLIATMFYAFAIKSLHIPGIQSQTQFNAFLSSIIGCLIWIPYFIYSKRVKNTFVK